MKFIVLDTETTGLNTREDRITEIGCIKVDENLIEVDQYHQYINPEYKISSGAESVTGLTNDILKGYPTFKEIQDNFLSFIDKDIIIAHNAKFDITIINSELRRNGKDILTNDFIDTLLLSRQKFPGYHANLDALSERLAIVTNREKHGALLDAYILLDVYRELIKVNRRSELKFTHVNIDWSKRKPRYETLVHETLVHKTLQPSCVHIRIS